MSEGLTPIKMRQFLSEVDRLREQVAWTVERCNAAIGDGFSGTPSSAVAAVCDQLPRLRAERDCALSLMTESQLEEWQTMMAARTSGGPS